MKLILCGGGSGDQNYYANKKLNEIIGNRPFYYFSNGKLDEKNNIL